MLYIKNNKHNKYKKFNLYTKNIKNTLLNKYEKYTVLISNNNIILKYNNTLLILKYIRYKYDNNYTLIKIINTIHKQLLIKIIKIIFNNQLELYGIIENNIRDNNGIFNNQPIKNNTNTLQEFVDKTTETCSNTIQYKSSS